MRSAVAASTSVLALVFIAACGGGDDGNGNAPGAEPAALTGVSWTLVSGLDVRGWEKSPPSATFVNGIVSGSTGCNRFTAPFTVDGDSMQIETIATTKIVCAPPADAIESAYLTALEQVAAWRLDGRALVLLNGDGGELLRYEAA